MKLANQVAVITGASQGMGAALVQAYRNRGYGVVATARSIGPTSDDQILEAPGDIAKSKAEGVHKGRKPTARAKAEEVRRLHTEGKTPTEIAKQLGIGRGSVYGTIESASA